VTASVRLPGRDRPLTIPDPAWAPGYPPPVSRSVYAAAHVAARPDGEIDWDATMAFRDHLWAYGFGVAEAMDTAQRGMGLSWDQARELIERSAARAAERGGAIVCGAGTDQLSDGSHSLAEIAGAYAEQLDVVSAAGAEPVLMASRALAASARSARDYLDLYADLLDHADRPVILHWLGETFDPALRGYWGSTDFAAAAGTVIELIQRCGGKVAGIKLSVLDDRQEIALRGRLPAGVRMYTGDDFNYAELIKGDAGGAGGGAGVGGGGHSDALLGAFAAITAPAAAALHALDAGDVAGYDAAMTPTVPLSRKIFTAPTYLYKTGVAFLAWLNGFQPYFVMLDGLQDKRGPDHLVEVFELAVAAGAITDADQAAARMTAYLAGAGLT
jgi:hypothetical protein